MKSRNLPSLAIALSVILSVVFPASAVIHTVTNTNDTGPGSFREILGSCYSGTDTILFNIPTTDPGYNSTTGVWTILTQVQGYTIPSGTTIIGTIVSAPLAKSDESRPGIEFDGTAVKAEGHTGFNLNDNVKMYGLIINTYQYGIWIDDENIVLEGCYIGTDPTGTSAKPNGINGIVLINESVNCRIQGNLISGNESYGLRLAGTGIKENTILENKIGTDITGNNALPNGSGGIYLHAGANHNTVELNLISGNSGFGIDFYFAGTDSNIVRFNRIGTNAEGTAPLPNSTFGLAIGEGPRYNTIGPGNVISHNNMSGVLVDGQNNAYLTIGNRITQNSITSNVSLGIYNMRGGNLELPEPVITSVSTAQITGTAGPNQTVEIFFDSDIEGEFYFGSTTSDGSGNFTYAVSAPLPPLPNVTATATDANGNTSEFSIPFTPTGVEEESDSAISPEFLLQQNRPNPFNSSTDISYSIPRSGHVRLAVYDMLGREVLTIVNEPQTAGTHTVRLDASKLSSGIYFYRLKTAGRVLSRKFLLIG